MSSSQKNSLTLGLAAGLTAAVVTVAPARSHAHEMRAALTDSCPTTNYPESVGGKAEALGPLANSILSSVAGTLIDTGIAALKKKVNPGNATAEGKFLQNGLYAYTNVTADGKTVPTVLLSDSMECLVVAVGTFPSIEAQAEPVAAFDFPFKPDRDAQVATKYLRQALDVKAAPVLALYFEAAKKTSEDRTAVTWQPVRFYVGEYLNDGFFAGRSRSTQIEMRMYKPASEKPFYSQDFPFDDVRKPFDKGPKNLQTNNAGTWGVLPASPNLPAKLTATDTGRPFDPFTLEVRVVEAPKPYALAIAFADAVEKNKDQIKTQVNEALNPDLKQKNELSGESTTLTAIGDYLTAFTDAKGKCTADKKKEADGKLGCSVALDKAEVARQKAELACKTQGVASCGSMPQVSEAGSAT